MKRLKRIHLSTYVTKVDLPFLEHILSTVKRACTGIVEGWVTYREVIRDIVRLRPKHGKRSGGDCRVGTGWGPQTERAGVDGPLAVGSRGVTSGIRAG